MATVSKTWVPDRHDMIWSDFIWFNERTGFVIGLPMTHAADNETNPFAVKYTGPKVEMGSVLTHHPKSFDWRVRGARPHHWKQLSPSVFEEACEGLNSIISL